MTYMPPAVGAAGLSIPAYNDIVNSLVASFQATYGVTTALGNDNADYQWISVFSLMVSDTMNAIQLAYNNFSPVTAIGAGLSNIVAVNGLTRKAATYSTCTVSIIGLSGTIIKNGVVGDINGNLWNLPSPTTIGPGGSVLVTATAQQLGAINALANQIVNIISGATAGWTGVTNGSNVASIGLPAETDSQLRARQMVSTELPSITILAGTIAAIAAVPGVTRYNVLENFTNATDANGNPPHSVTAVVEGGADIDVATAIYNNRGIGPLTNGTDTVDVTDPNSGVVTAISFDRPTYVPIYVTVNAHLLPGGTSATLTAIANTLVAYLNSLQIGELVSFTALVAVAMNVNANLSMPMVSVISMFSAVTSSPTSRADIPLTFYEVSQGLIANIVVNSV
jgi:hypothetical protein